jgi:aspartyl/asparaginyl beta-hydroxylase (cupin superfamily)
MSVSIPLGLTLNVLLERTRNEMDGRFLTYSARDNNYQDFVLASMKSNNLATPINILFAKQATQHLFTPELRRITNTITDIAGKADVLIQGGQVSEDTINNPTIGHVRKFARANNISFMDALQSP